MKLRNKKTGEIIEGESIVHIIRKLHDRGDVMFRGPVLSLDLFREYWEVCSEPRIKNKRYRFVIKSWAEVNSIIDVLYDKDKDCIYSPCGSDNTDTNVSISFDTYEVFKGLEHRKLYSIDELCGN